MSKDWKKKKKKKTIKRFLKNYFRQLTFNASNTNLSESKTLQYFCNIKHTLAASGSFAKFVKVTEQGDAEIV